MWDSTAIITMVALSCFTLGGVTAWLILWLVRSERPTATPPQPVSIDPNLDNQMAQHAANWAQQRGTPQLADLAHHRLRLAAWLAERTRSRYLR